MTLLRPNATTAWPLGIARTCANGDGRTTLVTLHGVPLCGKCALDLLQEQGAAIGQVS